MLAVVSLDVQMLLGLLLYVFLSPFTRDALNDFGAAMRTPSLRYWAVEHVTLMVGALVVAHVGNVLVRRASTDPSRHLRGAISLGSPCFSRSLEPPGLACQTAASSSDSPSRRSARCARACRELTLPSRPLRNAGAILPA